MRTAVPGRVLLSAMTTLTLPVLVSPAFAQQQSTQTSAPASASEGLQEIVVTAQRRQENILDVPMAVTANSGAELTQLGVRNFDDLQFVTPGYYATDVAGSAEMYIRGIGNNVDIGADPSVAMFVDDVPRIFGQLFNQFSDVERIEVLKGAQGGLYGRNATGGVINVITRQPTTEKFEATAMVSYGEKNTFQASGFANLPLNDVVAWTLSGERDVHDPYVTNVYASAHPYTAAMFPQGSFLGTPAQTAAFFNSDIHPPWDGLDNQNVWMMDTKLLIKPLDNFKVTLAYDYNDKADSNGDQLYQATPAYMLGVIQYGFFGGAGINANLPPSFAVSGNGPFSTTKSTLMSLDIRDYGASVRAVYSLPGVDLQSISAYRVNCVTDYNEELEDLPIPAIALNLGYRRSFWYQELRAISTDSGPWHYLGGATYLYENQASISDLSELQPLVVDLPTAVSSQLVRNYSVYAQLGYDLTQALNFTVGGRQIHETNDSSFTVPQGNGTSTTEQKFLPSATLSYKLEGGGNAYARFAEGFKTGGVNPLNPPSFFPQPNLGSTFGGETVYTYEIGYRAPFLDNRLQSTTAIFYNNYQNLQIAAHTTPAYADILLAIVNGGDARTYGAEEQIAWRVIQPFTLGVSAAYLNAKYKTFEIAPNPVLSPLDLSGQTMINSPDFQFTATAALDQPLTDQFNLIGNVLFSHTSQVLLQQSGAPGVIPPAVQPAYNLVNLHVGVRTADGHYQLTVGADNLFNQAYFVGGSSSGSGGTVYQWGNPRIVRGQFIYKY